MTTVSPPPGPNSTLDRRYGYIDDPVHPLYNRFDMAWIPVFSPDNRYLAAKVERDGKYTIAVNDRLWSHNCDAIWDPVFSPDSRKILLKSLEDGNYIRRVLPVTDLAS